MNLQMGFQDAQPVICFDAKTKEKIGDYKSFMQAGAYLGTSPSIVRMNAYRQNERGIYSRKLDKRVFFKLKK